MDLAGRRTFLRGAAGAAALTVTSYMSVFGRTHRLNVSAALTGAAPNLPDRLPPDWYRRKIAPGSARNGETQPRRAGPAARRERHLHHRLLSSFDRASVGCPHPQIRRPRP